MRKGGGVIQNQGMRAAVVITALVVGMVFGIGFDGWSLGSALMIIKV